MPERATSSIWNVYCFTRRHPCTSFQHYSFHFLVCPPCQCENSRHWDLKRSVSALQQCFEERHYLGSYITGNAELVFYAFINRTRTFHYEQEPRLQKEPEKIFKAAAIERLSCVILFGFLLSLRNFFKSSQMVEKS